MAQYTIVPVIILRHVEIQSRLSQTLSIWQSATLSTIKEAAFISICYVHTRVHPLMLFYLILGDLPCEATN